MADPASLNLSSPGLAVDLRRSLALLGSPGRRRLGVLTLTQVATGLLDLAGILLFGLVGILAASISQGQGPPHLVVEVQSLLGIDSLSVSILALGVGALTAVFLLGKSVLYAIVLRRIYRFLAKSQAAVATQLSVGLVRSTPASIEHLSRARMSYAVFHGTYHAVTALLGSVSILVSEVALLSFIAVALLVIDPALTVVSALYFVMVGIVVYRLLSRRSEDAGSARARSAIDGYQLVQESLQGHREISVSGRRQVFELAIFRKITESSSAAAQELFLGQLPKLIYEACMVVAAVVIVGWQLASSDLVRALGVLVVFLAAAARLLPSLLRINAQLLAARSSAAQAQPTYEIAALLRNAPSHTPTDGNVFNRDVDADDLNAVVEVTSVTYRYPNSQAPALNDVSLSIPAGALVGVAGPSGAGKSTLADIILGVAQPSSGSVRIAGVQPGVLSLGLPGYMAYLPQDVTVLNGTVRDNILFGLDRLSIPDSSVWNALSRAHLDSFVESLPEGLDAHVGEDGAKMSGGQRQRLGLARILLAQPRVIVFDEATSALDSATELAVTRAIHGEVGFKATRIVIAHRLASLVDADLVVYMESGRVVAAGTFSSVRDAVPAFDYQAKILGL